jgi:hypothetical protein
MELAAAMAAVERKYALQPAERVYILHAEMTAAISPLLPLDHHQAEDD